MIQRIIDAALEATVVPSFTKVGSAVRSRVDRWTPLDSYDLSNRNFVVTGGTSGLGRAAALQFLRCGAHVTIVGRNADRNQLVASELVDECARTDRDARIATSMADMGDLDAVRALAAELSDRYEVIDVLVHNAGALTAERNENAEGIEATVASQVVGPFLLTGLLLDRLQSASNARVITMSSGGMYTVPLEVDRLEMEPGRYRGAQQYALAKRAQVTLNELWAERRPDIGVTFHAMHPGWADTPGVQESLPGFATMLGPLLRSDVDGADTLVWLAADDEPLATNGEFWHDRRPRAIHRLFTTRRSDTPARRAELWDWVASRAALDPAPTPAPE